MLYLDARKLLKEVAVASPLKSPSPTCLIVLRPPSWVNHPDDIISSAYFLQYLLALAFSPSLTHSFIPPAIFLQNPVFRYSDPKPFLVTNSFLAMLRGALSSRVTKILNESIPAHLIAKVSSQLNQDNESRITITFTAELCPDLIITESVTVTHTKIGRAHV